MNLSENLLEKLGIAAIFSGAVFLIIRKLIEQFFSKRSEKFKAELEKEVIKDRTRFETLHAEHIAVIKEVFNRIVKTHSAFLSLVNPLLNKPTLEERVKQLTEEYNYLVDYYTTNRILFGEGLARDIDELLKKFKDIWDTMCFVKYLEEKGIQNPNPNKEWLGAWRGVKNEIPPIIESIEKKCRDIIGIE